MFRPDFWELDAQTISYHIKGLLLREKHGFVTMRLSLFLPVEPPHELNDTDVGAAGSEQH